MNSSNVSLSSMKKQLKELKYKNWRLDECVRDETCSVVRIGIECNDCNRDSISMMFVMNRSVLEC